MSSSLFWIPLYCFCAVIYTIKATEHPSSIVCLNHTLSSCSSHDLQCASDETIVINKAKYGFIEFSNICHQQENICSEHYSHCCRVDEKHDYLEEYDDVPLANLYTSCNGLKSCLHMVQYDKDFNITVANRHLSITYSSISYVCSKDAQRFDLISQDIVGEHHVNEMTIVTSPSSLPYLTCRIEFNTTYIFVYQDNADDKKLCIHGQKIKPRVWYVVEDVAELNFQPLVKNFTVIFRAQTLQNRFKMACRNLTTEDGISDDNTQHKKEEVKPPYCIEAITYRKSTKSEMENYFKLPPTEGSAGSVDEDEDVDVVVDVDDKENDGDEHDGDEHDGDDIPRNGHYKTITIAIVAAGVVVFVAVVIILVHVRKRRRRRLKKSADGQKGGNDVGTNERHEYNYVDNLPVGYEEVDLVDGITDAKTPGQVTGTSGEPHNTYTHIGLTKNDNSNHMSSKNHNSQQPSSADDAYNHIGLIRNLNSEHTSSVNNDYDHIGKPTNDNSQPTLCSKNDNYNHIELNKNESSDNTSPRNGNYNHTWNEECQLITQGGIKIRRLDQSDATDRPDENKADNPNNDDYSHIGEIKEHSIGSDYNHVGEVKNDNTVESDYNHIGEVKNDNSIDGDYNHIGEVKNNNSAESDYNHVGVTKNDNSCN